MERLHGPENFRVVVLLVFIKASVLKAYKGARSLSTSVLMVMLAVLDTRKIIELSNTFPEGNVNGSGIPPSSSSIG